MIPRKVLIVDDSRIMHKMYQVLLEGFSLLHAFSGLEAMAALAEHQDIDLILLDIVMPEMNGVEFLSRLSEEPPTRPVPVILASFEEQLMGSLQQIAKGIIAVLKKPVRREALLEAIRRLDTLSLPRHGAGHKAKAPAPELPKKVSTSIAFTWKPPAVATRLGPVSQKSR